MCMGVGECLPSFQGGVDRLALIVRGWLLGLEMRSVGRATFDEGLIEPTWICGAARLLHHSIPLEPEAHQGAWPVSGRVEGMADHALAVRRSSGRGTQRVDARRRHGYHGDRGSCISGPNDLGPPSGRCS